ncbi:hypothetical protein HUN08_11640 [Gordonia sp. X0973]|uniref:hypothetical protein n=1 Tax=Gordonia sp. X0973 TaxID=2742602 RepID=UPI0013EBFCD7|nr:hypothetical protein [Gordonia sp. X0973]QKT07768.1 hypothetical protein HUN08_11640 [Gordonia sp. X0973]
MRKRDFGEIGADDRGAVGSADVQAIFAAAGHRVSECYSGFGEAFGVVIRDER